MNSKTKSILHVNTEPHHDLDDPNVFLLHPKKLNWLMSFEKNTFDAANIVNVVAKDLKSLGLFNIHRVMKDNAMVEIVILQPISVMQELDAVEIEANAKLAGFTDIQQLPYEKWVKGEDGKDKKLSTIKLSMMKTEKPADSGKK